MVIEFMNSNSLLAQQILRKFDIVGKWVREAAPGLIRNKPLHLIASYCMCVLNHYL